MSLHISYFAISLFLLQDRFCVPCSEGSYSDGEVESCTSHSACNFGIEYEAKVPSLTSDRECLLITVCTGVQYEAAKPTITSNRLCKPVSELKSVTISFRDAAWGAHAATPAMQEAFKSLVHDMLISQFAKEGLQNATYIGVDLFEDTTDSSVLARINVTFSGAKAAIEQSVRNGSFSVQSTSGERFTASAYAGAASTGGQSAVPKDHTHTYIAIATAVAIVIVSVSLAVYIHRRIHKEVYQPILSVVCCVVLCCVCAGSVLTRSFSFPGCLHQVLEKEVLLDHLRL